MPDNMEHQHLFSLRRVDWDRKAFKNSKVKARVVQNVVVNSTTMFVGTSGGILQRCKLNDPSKEPEEIEISSRSEDVFENIFVDNSGHHVIIALKSGDNYYLHSKSTKAKKISKVMGNIECVAFDRTNTNENSTKSFLVGTSTGNIYEISIDNSGKEKCFQMVFQLTPPLPITSIYFEALTNDSYFALFATESPTRLYHLVGGPTLSQLFSDASHNGEPPFTELPGDIKNADLHCFSKVVSPKADSFALMTGAGIYYGSLKDIKLGLEIVVLPFNKAPLSTCSLLLIGRKMLLLRLISCHTQIQLKEIQILSMKLKVSEESQFL
jgi:hypothetical protein